MVFRVQSPSQAFLGLVATGCMRAVATGMDPAPGGGRSITLQSGLALACMAPQPPTISLREAQKAKSFSHV